MQNKTIDNLRSGFSPSRWKILLSGLLVIGILGCSSDKRVSLREFQNMLEQQDAVQTESTPATHAIARQSMSPFRISPEDVLSITVTPGDQIVPAQPLKQRVRSDGTIDLPLVGTINVGGLRPSEAEGVIRDAYMPKYYTQAIVHLEVPEPDSIEVLVVGAVQRPGLIRLRRNERHLLWAVDRAGGSTERASGVVTIRKLSQTGQPGQNDTLNLRKPEELRKALAMEPLESGDIVTVHAAQPNTVTIGGLVNFPGPQTYRQGTEITALQALVTAGGGRMDLMPHDATLIRRINGEDVHVKLDINRLMKGQDENFALAAGDILWVPHTAETRVREFLNEAIYIRAGITANYSAYYSDAGSKYHGDLKDTPVSTFLIGP